MRIRSFLAGLAAVALIATTASAQEEEEEAPKQAYSVLSFELEPGTMRTWRGAVERMAAAATAADLSGPDYGWWAWHEDNRTVIIWPVPQDELFHDNPIFEKLAEADSAEAAAIGEMFEEASGRQTAVEIMEIQLDLSYQPAYPIEGAPGGADVWDLIIADGEGEAFQESMKEFVEILGEMNYPYQMQVYRVRYGAQRTQLVTFFDDQESYHGPNNFGKLLEGKPELAERVEEAYSKFLTSVSSMETSVYNYDEEGSFPPVPGS